MVDSPPASRLLTQVVPPLDLNNVSSVEVARETFSAVRAVDQYKWQLITVALCGYLAVQVCHYFFVHQRPPKGLKRIPAIRSTIPWVGRMHDVDIQAPWFAWTKFAIDFNGICASTIAGDMHLWVSDMSVAREFLCKKARIYSSRPEIGGCPGSNTQAQYLPLLEYGDHWKSQRKFATTVLTAAKNKDYYGYVTHEVKHFMYGLIQDPKDHFAKCDRFCGRVAARMGYGRPDSAAAHCENAGNFISQISPAGSITNLIAALRNLPEFIMPTVRASRMRRENEEKLWKGLMAQAQRDLDRGIAAPVSYARTYLEHKTAEGGATAAVFDDHEAAYAVGMLVTVAIFTIGGPLYGFFLAMTLHPEAQAKLRQELDEQIGNRVVELSDSANLPYLRAAIKETLRWRPPVPLGVPRLLEEDDEWNGHFIPKGTVFHAVELAMARRAEIYPDPDDYLPERWLEPSYPTYQEPLTEHPRLIGFHGFGMGRRVCPGIELTEAEMLVACGTLINTFTLSPEVVDGKPRPPDPWGMCPNLIGGPSPFKTDIRIRSPEHMARVVRDYDDSVAAEAAGQAFHYA